MTNAAEPAPQATQVPPRRVRHDRRWIRPGTEVVLLVLLTFVVRLAAWFLRPAILPDSADLLDAGAAALAGTEHAILHAHHHPLPVWLVSILGDRWFGAQWDAETASSLAAAACAAIGAWPLHVLARTACGRHAATVAVVLYAVLPQLVSVGSLPLAEAWFIPLFIGSLAAAATAHLGRTPERRALRLAAAGALAGAAYLCRPEGLVAGVAVPMLALAQARPGRRLLSFLVVSAGFVVVAAPWVTLLSLDRGGFTLSPKKDLAKFAGVVAAPRDEGAEDMTSTAQAIAGATGALWDALGPGLLIALIGALPRRRWGRRSGRLRTVMLLTCAVFFLLLMRLRSGWGYGGGRHALAAAVLLLPFAGEGVLTLTAFISRAVRRRTTALTLTMLAAIPIATLAILRPDGEGGERERHLGLSLAHAAQERWTNDGGPTELVLASFQEPLVAYYADRELRTLASAISAPDTAPPRRASARNVRLLADHGRLVTLSADLKSERRLLAERLRSEHVDWLVLNLFRQTESLGAPRRSGADLAKALTSDGLLGTPVIAAGSELAAFPVIPAR